MEKTRLTQEQLDSLYNFAHLSTYEDSEGNLGNGVQEDKVFLSEEDCLKFKKGYTIVVQSRNKQLFFLTPRNGEVGEAKNGKIIPLVEFKRFKYGSYLPIAKTLGTLDASSVRTYKTHRVGGGGGSKRVVLTLHQYTHPLILIEIDSDIYIVPKDKCYHGNSRNKKNFRTFTDKEGVTYTHACEVEDLIPFVESKYSVNSNEDVEASERILQKLKVLYDFNIMLVQKKKNEKRSNDANWILNWTEQYKNGEISKAELNRKIGDL